MTIYRILLAIGVCSALNLYCSSISSLSEAEKAKLDPPLLHLLTDKPTEENRLTIGTRSDGTKEYTVIIRSNRAEDIKEMGIAVSSVFGDVIVARVTKTELRKIVSLPSVRALEVGSKSTIQPQR